MCSCHIVVLHHHHGTTKTIQAAVEQFQTFIISISYLLGVIDALLIAGLTTIASAASYSPITSSYSIPTTCHIAKNIANFIGYFAPGCTLIIMQIILLVKGTDLLDSDPK